MSDNLYKFKCRFRPKDYLDGPVRVFTDAEKRAWESSSASSRIYAKIENQCQLSTEEIRYLDTLSLQQAEIEFSEILEGVNVNDINNDRWLG